MVKEIYIENNKIHIDNAAVEIFGEDILILGNHQVKLFSGKLFDFHSEIIKNEIFKNIEKVELFVKIKDKFFYVNKTFILNNKELPLKNNYEKQIRNLLSQFNERIEDYIL